MSDERTDPPGAGRCPECGARVRPGQAWCTLCNAILPDDSSADADVSSTAVPESGYLGAGDAAAPAEPATDAPERPAPEAAAVEPAAVEPAAAEPAAAEPAAEPATVSAGEPGARGWADWIEPPRPARARAAVPAADLDSDPDPAPEPGEIDVLLARLAASESGIAGFGPLAPGGGPVPRVALVFGAGLVVTGLLLGGLTLFGSLL